VPSTAPHTVGTLLRDAAERLTEGGSETPRLDAELLLGHVLRVDRATLLAGPEAGVGADAEREFEGFVERRANGEPVSYIRGLKEFYGLIFTVDQRALIPRPETETLVDLALGRITTMLTAAPRHEDDPLRVWDVGTGSGAIVVALAVESRRRGYARDVRFRATDVSDEALSLAVENAVVHGVADAIEFALTDLTDLTDLPESAADAARADQREEADLDAVDLLLANLPYIPTEVVPTLPAAASFEPVSALDGGPDGLDLIRRLVGSLDQVLGPSGMALLEIGADQAEAVKDVVAARGSGWIAHVHDDLARQPRVVEIVRELG
jgi:release factor glutamine methyltransferase